MRLAEVVVVVRGVYAAVSHVVSPTSVSRPSAKEKTITQFKFS